MSTSPASLAAQFECAQGIPVFPISARLEASTAPFFDSQSASLRNNPRVRTLLEISGFQPLLDICPNPEIVLNGSAS